MKYVCVRGVFNISIIIFVHVDSHVLTLAADCQLLCTLSPHLDKQVTPWRHLLFLHQYYVDATLQQFNAYVFFFPSVLNRLWSKDLYSTLLFSTCRERVCITDCSSVLN